MTEANEPRVLAGRYRLIRPLGHGGMGSVWQAIHVSLGTPLAVKLIDPALATSAPAIARFKREAQAAAALRGTHVVQIIDYGIDGNTPFIAMELLEGEPLRSRLQRVVRLDPARTVEMLVQVGKAVSRAHDAGIVHRDLKPENIFLSIDGDEEVVKVLDFGIAKSVSPLGAVPYPTTDAGTMVGTPYYMSPEQCLGTKELDRRTDVWALGVVAYECLLGRRPFEAETIGALVAAICRGAPPTPSSFGRVPPGFDAWFARSTAHSPDQRHFSVREQLTELRRVCRHDLCDTAFLGSVESELGNDAGEAWCAGTSLGSEAITRPSAALPLGVPEASKCRRPAVPPAVVQSGATLGSGRDSAAAEPVPARPRAISSFRILALGVAGAVGVCGVGGALLDAFDVASLGFRTAPGATSPTPQPSEQGAPNAATPSLPTQSSTGPSTPAPLQRTATLPAASGDPQGSASGPTVEPLPSSNAARIRAGEGSLPAPPNGVTPRTHSARPAGASARLGIAAPNPRIAGLKTASSSTPNAALRASGQDSVPQSPVLAPTPEERLAF